MKFKTLLMLIIVCLIVMSLSGYQILYAQQADSPKSQPADLQASYARLASLSQELYRTASEGNRQLFYSHLQRMNRLASDAAIRKSGNPQGWKAVDQLLFQLSAHMKQAGAGSSSEQRQASAQLMLAFDALSSSEQALWLSYNEVIKEDINRMFLGWRRSTGDGQEAAYAALRPLQNHMELIRVPALLQRDQADLAALQEAVRYVGLLLAADKTERAASDWTDQAFVRLSNAADHLFNPSNTTVQAAAFSPVDTSMPWRWTFLFSSLILSVLTFSAWRKFRYERDAIIGMKPPNPL